MSNQETFIDLLQPNLASLNRFVLVSVRDGFDADDIVQETMYKAFLHYKDFRGESKFKTWLMAIALNEVRSRRRAEARSRISYVDTDQLEIVAGTGTKEPWFSDVDRSERIKRLRDAISSLRPTDKEVIHLRGVEGLTLADTARQLSISIAAVKSRYHRAVDHLRTKVANPGTTARRLNVLPKTKPLPTASQAERQRGPLAA